MSLNEPGRAPVATPDIALGVEDPAQFQTLTRDYLRRHRPIDGPERHQVDKIIIAAWRQRRLWRIEAALYEIEMSNSDLAYPLQAHPDDVRLTKAFLGQDTVEQALKRLAKMESQLNTVTTRAERAFSVLQQNRQNEPETAHTETQNEQNEPETSALPLRPPRLSGEFSQNEPKTLAPPSCPSRLSGGSSQNEPDNADLYRGIDFLLGRLHDKPTLSA
jgi:hypothetical protein